MLLALVITKITFSIYLTIDTDDKSYNIKLNCMSHIESKCHIMKKINSSLQLIRSHKIIENQFFQIAQATP